VNPNTPLDWLHRVNKVNTHTHTHPPHTHIMFAEKNMVCFFAVP